MKKVIYHSPDGDRPLFTEKINSDGTADLVGEDGVLQIGKCPVASHEGGCSLLEVEEETKELKPEKPKKGND